jgi:glycine betaine/choline ABC-type transport system substrate-binding protein
MGTALTDVIDAVSRRLTTADLRRLNGSAGVAGADLRAIAGHWLRTGMT